MKENVKLTPPPASPLGTANEPSRPPLRTYRHFPSYKYIKSRIITMFNNIGGGSSD